MTRIILGIFVVIIKCTYLASGNFVCNNTDEFYFTAPETNCGLYYRCRDGQRINYLECPVGKVFDFSLQKCIERRNKVSCEDPTCFGKPDGYHADTTQNCQRYFRCQSGQLLTFESCKRGFLFNGKVCEPTESFKCDIFKHSKRSCNNHQMDDCQLLNDGLYPDESSKDCKSYIKCANGKTSHLRCPSSTVFHPNQGSCVPDVIYECPKSIRLDRLCKGKSDGYHVDPRYGCNAFVRCHRGVPIQFDECPSGQVFDSVKRYCTFKPTTPCHHEPRSSDCMHLEMGFYQDRSLESSCRNYYFCFNGRKTIFSCPVGELFNGESCVNDRYYSCPNLDADSCDTKEDGYYKDNSLDCRSYFFCSSNRKFSFLCKSGEAFDGNKCVSKRHVEMCTKSFDCVGKSNGYHQDLKSGCTKYFYCKQSEKLQILTCRNGRIFNGNSCVSPQSYVCPNVGEKIAQRLNCVPRKCDKVCQRDGFFADYDSRCKNYYFCVNGNQSKLSCMKNFVFNENEGICVPQDKYQCPVYCSSECS